MIKVTHRFAAPPERVFDAWLDPARIAHWMVAPAMKLTGRRDEIVKIEVDARVGGKFSFVVRREGQEIDHTGEYLELDRPLRLVFTWGTPAFSAAFSTVALDFKPDGTGTLVELTAKDVPDEYAERTQAGWAHILAATADLDGSSS